MDIILALTAQGSALLAGLLAVWARQQQVLRRLRQIGHAVAELRDRVDELAGKIPPR